MQKRAGEVRGRPAAPGRGPRACLFMKRRGERRTAPPAVASRAAATGRRPAGGKGTLRNPERSLAQAAGIPGSSPFLSTGLAHRDGTGRSAWGDHHISVTHSRLPLPCHPDLSYASWSPQLLLVPKHRLAEHPGLASPAPNPPGTRLCSFPPLPVQGPRDAVSGESESSPRGASENSGQSCSQENESLSLGHRDRLEAEEAVTVTAELPASLAR